MVKTSVEALALDNDHAVTVTLQIEPVDPENHENSPIQFELPINAYVEVPRKPGQSLEAHQEAARHALADYLSRLAAEMRNPSDER